MRPPPWRLTADRKSHRGFLCLWMLVVAVDVAAAVWVHSRDTHAGDQWDWSDWFEALVFAFGFSVVATFLAWSCVASLLARIGRTRAEKLGMRNG